MSTKRLKDFKDSKVFCPAPFVHYFVHSSDVPKPCCAAEIYDTWEMPGVVRGLRDEWESHHYTKLRDAMFNDEKSEICKRCYDIEDAGGKSDRLMFMNSYMNTNSELELNLNTGNEFNGPLDLDLRPGNLCNLQCRMCSPASSSQLNKEVQKNKELLKFLPEFNEENESIWTSDRNLDFLLSNIEKGIKRIKFLGGEPTIMPDVERILDYLIDNNKTDVRLSFTSNMTNANSRFLNKISKFKEVGYTASLDGIGKSLEYIRHPVNWEKTLENINTIASIDNVSQKIDMSFTLQAYNFTRIKETIEWIVDYNSKQDKCKIHLQVLNLTHPQYHSYRSLPKYIRRRVIKDIMSSDAFNHPDIQQTNLKYCLEIISADEEFNGIWKLANVTKRFDKARNQHIKDYIPELWEIMQEEYNDIRI